MRDDSVVPQKSFLSNRVFNLMQASVPIVCIDLVILRRGPSSKTEILLIKRSLKTEIGKWCNIGGRVIKNERLAATIKRQAKKELGVSVAILPPWRPNCPLCVMDDPKADPQKHSITLVYPVTIKSGELKNCGPEFNDVRWFNAKKLPRPIGFNHRQELKAVLKEIKNSPL